MGRLKTFGVFLTFLAVAALTGSVVHGLFPPAERPAQTAEADAPQPEEAPAIRVEVLNGSGIPGQAQALTRVLREQGFDVVYFGNAATFDVDTTVVIDRVGAIDRARAVADSIGLRRVESEPDRDLYLDVTVLLGTDWEAPGPEEE